MKKSSFYRALQVASILTVYSVLYIWASTAHVEIVSEILDSLDSVLLSLAIAVVLPVICFKVLSKLANRPAFLDRQPSSTSISKAVATQDLDQGLAEYEDANLMQYRGIWYKPEDLTSDAAPTSNLDTAEDDTPINHKLVVKYRGVDVEISASNPEINKAMEPNINPSAQTSAEIKKTRVKYRGAYLD
jgi:hypothetical protein